jgi:hypothetical protein
MLCQTPAHVGIGRLVKAWGAYFLRIRNEECKSPFVKLCSLAGYILKLFSVSPVDGTYFTP